jgi:hypothetical protein
MRQLLLSFLRVPAYGGDLDPTRPPCARTWFAVTCLVTVGVGFGDFFLVRPCVVKREFSGDLASSSYILMTAVSEMSISVFNNGIESID